MNRTVVSGVAAFALLIGAGLAMNETTAEAGLFAKHSRCGGGHARGGGIFKKRCGGGLFARLKAKHAAKRCADPCAPAPCAPAVADCGGCGAAADCGGCAPANDCGGCAPANNCGGCGAPADCGGCGVAASAPCADCGGGVVVEGGAVGQVAHGDMNLAPGEVLVPGSIQTVGEGGGDGELPPASSSDEAPPAPVPDAASDAA